ncbi:MAG: formylglycine-generating enzyme family protein, partial [Chitinophagaceae bacterium]
MKKIVLLVMWMNVFFSSHSQSPGDTSFIKYEQLLPGSTVKFTMLPIPAGTFVMGSPAKDKMKEADETPQHTIKL